MIKEGNLINDLKPIEFNQNYHEVKINNTEELLELINNKIQDNDKEIADELIEDLIKSLKENELKEYRKYKKDGELKSRKLFNHYIKDEGYYEYLDRTLYIEYRKIFENYNQYLSNELNDYLEIKYNQKEKALLQDAALTISLDTFVERITTYETFLNSYPDSKYLEEVAEPFKLMMSILIYPNFGNTRYFEGVPRSELNKQNKPKEDFIDVYKKIINHEKKAEISQTVAKKLLNTVKKSDSDDLSEIDLQQFIEDVELKIEEKYLNNN